MGLTSLYRLSNLINLKYFQIRIIENEIGLRQEIPENSRALRKIPDADCTAARGR